MCWDELVLGWREIEEVSSEHTSRKRGKYMLVRPQLEGQYKRWGRSDQINYTCWPLNSHKLLLKVCTFLRTKSKLFLDIFISYVHAQIPLPLYCFMVKKRPECNALDQGQRPPKQGRSAPISVQSLQIPPFWLSCPEIEGEVEDIPESPPVLGSGRVGRNKDGLELPTSLQ